MVDTNFVTEKHPLSPFLPPNARLLMLGSFPPPRKRWCMDFFYPNWSNDMWRIWGYIVKGDKNYFTIPNEKSFDKVKIEQFCFDNGLALYDTAEEIVRLKNNASDNFLQVVRPTDLSGLLKKIPHCRAIVATGQKSAEILQASVGCNSLPIGGCFDTEFEGRKIAIWRMPSTSRAYPRPIEWKAEYYRNMFEQISVCKM